jgi:hypothetical protein
MKYAIIAVNKAAVLNKLYATITLMEYFDFFRNTSKYKLIARIADKKISVNLADFKAIIKKHG